MGGGDKGQEGDRGWQEQEENEKGNRKGNMRGRRRRGKEFLKFEDVKWREVTLVHPAESVREASHVRRDDSHNQVQCSAVQCSAVQFSLEQYSAVQWSAVHCSAVQCSAVQWMTISSQVAPVEVRETCQRDEDCR